MLCARVSFAQAPVDTVHQLAAAAQEAKRIGVRHGESLWPGFRPDTIPLAFVIPARGDVLFGWRGALPQGYIAIPQLSGAAWHDSRQLGAASTAVVLEGRRVAQVVVGSLDPAGLVSTAIHEAFHVFELMSQRPQQRFGRGENSMLVTTYPVFDAENEAAFALEGKLLAQALAAETLTRKRELARAFVAVRRERHRRLPVEYAEFEGLSELHEGLAEYVLVRALTIEATEAPAAWRPGATHALARRRSLLDSLTGSDVLSLRFRFYQTGPAQALLLDALHGPAWKSELVRENSTLQDRLAVASGVDAVAIAARTTAETTIGIGTLRQAARESVERLKTKRSAIADSLLSMPGLRLVLAADSLPGRNFNVCGYDPQNLLQVTSTVRMQMRWWRPCAGGPSNAEFNVPSVLDAAAGIVSAVIGDEQDVKLTSNGQPITVRDGETLRDIGMFRLQAPRASVEAVRADISLHGSVLTIHPKMPSTDHYRVPSRLSWLFGAGSSSSFGIAPQSFLAAPFFTVPFRFGCSLTRWVDRFRPWPPLPPFMT